MLRGWLAPLLALIAVAGALGAAGQPAAAQAPPAVTITCPDRVDLPENDDEFAVEVTCTVRLSAPTQGELVVSNSYTVYDPDHAFWYSTSGIPVTIPDGADRASDVMAFNADESYAVVSVGAPPSPGGTYSAGSPGEACIDIGAGDGCATRPGATPQSSGTAEPEPEDACALNGLTCVERPAGADIVTVTSTSTTIAVEDDGDGATHDGSQDGIPSAVDVQFHEPDPDLVEQFKDEDGTIVVDIPTKYDEDGDRNHEAETNAARVEQALHELGKPYTVCFPEETITFYDEQTGEVDRTVTYPEECVLVTPSR